MLDWSGIDMVSGCKVMEKALCIAMRGSGSIFCLTIFSYIVKQAEEEATKIRDRIMI